LLEDTRTEKKPARINSSRILVPKVGPAAKRDRQRGYNEHGDGAAGGPVGSGASADAVCGSGGEKDAGGAGGDNDGAGGSDDGGGVVDADIDIDAGGDVGASGAAGAVVAAGEEGEGDGVGEDVRGDSADDVKRPFTQRRSVFLRQKTTALLVITWKPRLLGIQRVRTKRVLQVLIKPDSADDGFHSADTLDPILQEVVAEVHRFDVAASKDILSNAHRLVIPSASGRVKTGSSSKEGQGSRPGNAVLVVLQHSEQYSLWPAQGHPGDLGREVLL